MQTEGVTNAIRDDLFLTEIHFNLLGLFLNAMAGYGDERGSSTFRN